MGTKLGAPGQGAETGRTAHATARTGGWAEGSRRRDFAVLELIPQVFAFPGYDPTPEEDGLTGSGEPDVPAGSHKRN